MITFKYVSEKNEFETLQTKNQPLAALLECLAEYVYSAFKKDVVITQVFRTKAEQEKIYGKGTKRVSPHMLWQAVDIRDWIYTKDEKTAIIDWLKQYDPHNQMTYINQAKSRTVWLHEVGSNGMHFHIQYKGPPVYIFTEGMEITA